MRVCDFLLFLTSSDILIEVAHHGELDQRLIGSIGPPAVDLNPESLEGAGVEEAVQSQQRRDGLIGAAKSDEGSCITLCSRSRKRQFWRRGNGGQRMGSMGSGEGNWVRSRSARRTVGASRICLQ